MAEYKMSYEELLEYINEAIEKSRGDKQLLIRHEAEILTALTGVFGDESKANQREQEQLLELWSNKEVCKSQILFGKRYIRIHDSMLVFIKAFLTSGLCDYYISNAHNQCNSPIIAAVSAVVFAIFDILNKITYLDEFDFCLYLQLTEHYYEMKEFTKEDILRMYPMRSICNIKTNKWNCPYCVDNKCEIKEEDVDKAISSLVTKGVLKSDIKDIIVYSFG